MAIWSSLMVRAERPAKFRMTEQSSISLSTARDIMFAKMSYMGVGYSGYEYRECPLCGQGMWNGRCENPDCKYHWYPKEDKEEDKDED